jgi:YggT family protein
LSIYSLAIILRSFIGMMVDPYHPVAKFLRQITEPVLAPIRRVVPPVQAGGGFFDLSPMVALLLLWVFERVLIAVLLGLAR